MVGPKTGSEVKQVLDAERAGEPFLVFRDGAGQQVIRALLAEAPMLTLGRHSSCDISLDWDDKVSRTHAVLEWLGHTWTLSDDGISRNGTFLNGVRLTSRQRLVDGDALRVGRTLLAYRQPLDVAISPTSPEEAGAPVPLTPTQRRVLISLCRPFRVAGGYATPASNADIAAELVVSIDAVKAHMRSLFERFDVGDLPQNQKRAKVVERAFQSGLINEREL